jgi:hypothetical protein
LNDVDSYIANFWRATQQSPEAVAAYADAPVFEVDLHARHRWLVMSDDASEFRRRMRTEPDYYDVKVAGYWVWGLCAWIGSGWCVDQDHGEREIQEGRGAALGHDRGIRCEPPDGKTPMLTGRSKADVQKGVNRGPHQKRPLLGMPNDAGQRGTAGRGVHQPSSESPFEKRPLLGGRSERDNGHGVHRVASGQLPDSVMGGWNPVGWEQKPQLAVWNDQGTHARNNHDTCEIRRAWLIDWFGRLRDRLRTVRVCCGDWKRVCDSESVTTRLGLVGLFLDPPYAQDIERLHAWISHLKGNGDAPAPGKRGVNRSADLYSNDRTQDVDRLVAEVHMYCLERGSDPLMRICLAGYAGQNEELEQRGWTVVAWKSSGGYGNRSSRGKENAARERLFFSPACLDPNATAGPLFDG